jgi:hypothetical protein
MPALGQFYWILNKLKIAREHRPASPAQQVRAANMRNIISLLGKSQQAQPWVF